MNPVPLRHWLPIALFWVVAQVAIAVAMASPTFFYFNVATAQRVFGGSVGDYAVFDDVRVYNQYAVNALAGKVPYRDIRVEYPLLAFPFFYAPRLFVTNFDGYKVAFGREMLFFWAILVFVVARHVARREGSLTLLRRTLWGAAYGLAFGPLIVSRFDVLPTLLAYISALAWSNQRSATGGFLAGLGTFVKVFPGVVAVPNAFLELAHPRETRLRGTLAFLVTCALGALLWCALAGPKLRESLGYHTGRGLEIGSSYSGVAIAAAKLTGAPLEHDYNHKSEEILTPWSHGLARLAPIAQLAALIIVGWFARRSVPADAIRLSAAAIAALIVTGKVLSPQYMIWLWPFILSIEGRAGFRARAIYLAACVLTFLIYPWGFIGLVQFRPSMIVVLNVRNLMLILLCVVLVLPNAVKRPVEQAGAAAP